MLVLFAELIVQLHDAPDPTTEQPVILRYILRCDRDILDPKIGEVSLIAVIFDVQLHGESVDYGETAPFPQQREHLLRLVRTHEIVGQDALHILNAFLNDLIIIRTAVLAKEKLQYIDRDICPLFDGLGQILSDDPTVKVLPQFLVNDHVGVICFIAQFPLFHGASPYKSKPKSSAIAISIWNSISSGTSVPLVITSR